MSRVSFDDSQIMTSSPSVSTTTTFMDGSSSRCPSKNSVIKANWTQIQNDGSVSSNNNTKVFPTEEECISQCNNMYSIIESDQCLDALQQIFCSIKRPLTLREIYYRLNVNDMSEEDESGEGEDGENEGGRGEGGKGKGEGGGERYNPYQIYSTLDLWTKHPHSYFQWGRVIKKYPVLREHMYPNTESLDLLTQKIYNGERVSNQEVRREIIQTYNTIPYYNSFKKLVKNKKDRDVVATEVKEPVWIYLHAKNPLARINDSFLDDRPFLEEILLNGHVCYPEYLS